MDNPFTVRIATAAGGVAIKSRPLTALRPSAFGFARTHGRLFRDWLAEQITPGAAHPLKKENILLEGGRTPPHAVKTSHFENDASGGGLFRVTLDCPGDTTTTYTLRLVEEHDPSQPLAHFDPPFAHASFTFQRPGNS